MTKMNTYIVEHQGVWLPGFSVVVAKNEEDAEFLVVDYIKSSTNIKLTSERIEIVKLDTRNSGVTLIWDGDY